MPDGPPDDGEKKMLDQTHTLETHRPTHLGMFFNLSQLGVSLAGIACTPRSYSMGIDLGTTYSCVGIFKDGEALLKFPHLTGPCFSERDTATSQSALIRFITVGDPVTQTFLLNLIRRVQYTLSQRW